MASARPDQTAPIDNAAFADAVARAKQIAAKIQQNQPSQSPDAGGGGVKRPMEQDMVSGHNGHKRHASEASINAQLRAMAEQQQQQSFNIGHFDQRSQANEQAVQAAQAVAQQINQKIGVSSASMPEQSFGQRPGLGGMSAPVGGGGGGMMSDEHAIPDRMVGLVIGKGGETISTLQAKSGCKIQIAADSGGEPNRLSTLTGTPQAIACAKRLIQEIIDGACNTMMGGGGGGGNQGMQDHCLEMKVPGNKVGLVIGKGGETIKQIQEETGAKMVMIQDSNQQTHCEKPLRISGDMIQCERAKERVLELITDKEEHMHKAGSYGSMGNNKRDITVPKNCVGHIIGKKGDMIKKIQEETGAKVQFKQDDYYCEDPHMNDERTCCISGSSQAVECAVAAVYELIEQKQRQAEMYGNRDGDMMGNRGGRGERGSRFSDGGQSRGGPNGYGGSGDESGEGLTETTFSVPFDKCGLVIGKGGENIRFINNSSHAHVELQKIPPPDASVKVFNVRGTPKQIQHAVEIICEKAGLPHPGLGPHMTHCQGGPHNGGQSGGGFNNYGGQPQNSGGTPQQYTPQGWNNVYQQWQQQGSNGDPSKQAQDDNTARWNAFYQYYGQQPQPGQAGQAPSQPGQSPSPAAPVTGQLDYSQQWAEYYRSHNMPEYAEEILRQAASRQTGQAPMNPQGQFGQGNQGQFYGQNQWGGNQPGQYGQYNQGWQQGS
ncbi:far upstream element-binding protein 3-like isoform X2 [Tubulanus polymorphus]|uniref:far upstream element-binding protein 3-like isoform X2 n=1 Tax=Tubulanus polymorphus TaxID=672921 RepID=UPI003DA35AE5